MGGHPPGLVEQLHGGGRDARLYLLLDDLVRNVLEVGVHLDEVVDADCHHRPLGDLVAVGRQGLLGRSVHGLEQLPTTDLGSPHGRGVEDRKERHDGGVQFGQAEERPVPLRGQDPKLGQENRGPDRPVDNWKPPAISFLRLLLRKAAAMPESASDFARWKSRRLEAVMNSTGDLIALELEATVAHHSSRLLWINVVNWKYALLRTSC